jgi:hypothetical protein
MRQGCLLSLHFSLLPCADYLFWQKSPALSFVAPLNLIGPVKVPNEPVCRHLILLTLHLSVHHTCILSLSMC